MRRSGDEGRTDPAQRDTGNRATRFTGCGAGGESSAPVDVLPDRRRSEGPRPVGSVLGLGVEDGQVCKQAGSVAIFTYTGI